MTTKQEDFIRKLIREELNSFQSEFILYRGVGMNEAIESCKLGHLIYYSRDAMSKDWEVIKYGLGDAASEMSEKDVDDYVNDLVTWTPNNKGVNLTSDLENAMGYSDIVLEINLIGDYAQFSDTHYFARKPKDCLVKYVYYKIKRYLKEEFLKIMVN